MDIQESRQDNISCDYQRMIQKDIFTIAYSIFVVVMMFLINQRIDIILAKIDLYYKRKKKRKK